MYTKGSKKLINGSSSIKRAAGRAVGGFGRKGFQLSQGSPELRDPMFNPETFYIAQDLQTMNRWIRYYDTFHPILPNSLDIHAFFPISDFSFKGVDDPYILDFYDYIKNDVLKLLDWVILASREYEVLGECFTFFGWDTYNGYFNTATILNPDLLEIYPFDFNGGRKYVISMDIPESFEILHMKKDMDMRYRQLWNNLDPVIRRCIESGLKIPLSPNNVFGMQRLAFSYDTRGTSQVLRVLKDLMHEDKLREAQMAVADGHITPYQIWKIGNTDKGYIPSEEELDDWNDLLQQAEHQNLFRIVTHDAVSYETKGIQDGLLPITPEIDKIEDRILTALYTSRAMTTGEGPTYSNAVIGLKVLEGRYQNKLYRISSIIRSLYKKIATANEFYKITPAQLAHRIRPSKKDRELMLPTVHWDNYFSFAKDLERAKFYKGLAETHKMSWKRVFDVLGLDYEEEKRLLKDDMGSVFQNEIFEAKIQQLVQMVDSNAPEGAVSPVGKGIPTNLASPDDEEGGAGILEEAGAEIPEGGAEPPMPDVDRQLAEI